MKTFKYTGIMPNGKKVVATIEARELIEAKIKLKEKKIRIIEIKEHKKRSKGFSLIKRKKLNAAQVSHFCRQFSIIISSGVNSITGLETLGRRASNPIIKLEIERIVSDIRVGSTIAETMQSPKSKFPKLLGSMVATGESTGKLDEVLKSMAIFYEKEHRIRQKIKSAATYPTIVLIVSTIMLFLFTSFMLPQMMESILEMGGEVPIVTKLVMGVGTFMSKNWVVVLISILCVIYFVSKYIKTPHGRILRDNMVDKIPLLGKGINCIVTMRFARALNLFVSTGCPLLQGLDQIIESVGNSIAEKALKQAKEGIIKGESLGVNLDASNYFDPVLVQMISIGEQTGELEVITTQMAEFYEQESDIYLNRLVAMVEPAMIIGVGILVAILVAAIFLPMINMYDAI